jgi:branched-chain amino acid transport system permease protein
VDWISVIVQGALLGGLYAMFAIGLAISFGVMRLVNIAHGDLIVLTAYLALSVVDALRIHPLASLAIVIPVMIVFGYILQRGVLNKVIGPDLLPPVLVTFGISIIIQNALLQFYSADARRLQAGWIETASIQLGGDLAVGLLPVIMFAAAIAIIAFLQLLFSRTETGRSFRAASDDPVTAGIMGIDTRHVYALAMALALAIGAVAGVFLGIRATFDPASGPVRLLFAFEAVIIGGMGSLWGTLAGGIILGIAQSIGAQFNANAQTLAGHLAFLLILLVRPEGLFPKTHD